MAGGTRTRAIPMELALGRLDRQVVDAREPALHQAVCSELPVLVSVGAEPVERIVVPLIGEANGDPALREGPHFLDQAVVELPRPLAREEFDDGGPSLNELGAIPPMAIDRIDQGDTL